MGGLFSVFRFIEGTDKPGPSRSNKVRPQKDADNDVDNDDSVHEAMDIAASIHEQRENDIIETMNETLTSESKLNMFNSFYDQTIGSVIVFSVETVVMALVVFGVYSGAYLVNHDSNVGPLLFMWQATSMLTASAVALAANTIAALCERSPVLYNRFFMMSSKAACGAISCVSTTFTVVAWHSWSDPQWSQVFFPSNRSHLSVLIVIAVAAQNALWVVSLLLTYASTPFGHSNAAMLELPVCAALILLYIITFEIGSHKHVVCTGEGVNTAYFIASNLFLLTSYLLFVASTQELLLPLSWEAVHATLTRPARVDVWSLVHGGLLIAALTFFIVVKQDMGETVVTAGYIFLALTVLVTVMQSFDLWFLLNKILKTDDETDRNILLVEQGFAVDRQQAHEIAKGVLEAKKAKHSKVAAMWAATRHPGVNTVFRQNGNELARQFGARTFAHVATDQLWDAKEDYDNSSTGDSEGRRSGKGGRNKRRRGRSGRRRSGSDSESSGNHDSSCSSRSVDTATQFALRDYGEVYGTRNRRGRTQIPSGVKLFPHIPVTMMREGL